MTAQDRWTALVAWAAERGVDERTLTDWIVLPERRGGCGWAWWRQDRGITAELEAWLRRRVERVVEGVRRLKQAAKGVPDAS